MPDTNDTITRLLRHPAVEAQAPCSSDDVERLHSRLSAPIPSIALDFWRASNGATLSTHDADLLSIPEVLDLLAVDGFGDTLLVMGFLPLLYDRESNYVAASITPPLAPCIIYVQHDNSPTVLYRDTARFFVGCISMLESDDFAGLYLHTTHGDYEPAAPRSSVDHAAAKHLIASGDDWDISIAVQLLDESCQEEWNMLLNSDSYSRRDAIHRLESIQSDAALGLLRRDAEEFGKFVDRVCDAATDAGISVTQQEQAVRIHGRWIDLNAFFGRRHIDNAIPRLVSWLRYIEDGNTPTDRPGHFMTD